MKSSSNKPPGSWFDISRCQLSIFGFLAQGADGQAAGWSTPRLVAPLVGSAPLQDIAVAHHLVEETELGDVIVAIARDGLKVQSPRGEQVASPAWS